MSYNIMDKTERRKLTNKKYYEKRKNKIEMIDNENQTDDYNLFENDTEIEAYINNLVEKRIKEKPKTTEKPITEKPITEKTEDNFFLNLMKNPTTIMTIGNLGLAIMNKMNFQMPSCSSSISQPQKSAQLLENSINCIKPVIF